MISGSWSMDAAPRAARTKNGALSYTRGWSPHSGPLHERERGRTLFVHPKGVVGSQTELFDRPFRRGRRSSADRKAGSFSTSSAKASIDLIDRTLAWTDSGTA